MSDLLFYVISVLICSIVILSVWVYVYKNSIRIDNEYIFIMYRATNLNQWISEFEGKVLKTKLHHSDIKCFKVGFITLAGTKNKTVKVITLDHQEIFTIFGNAPLPFTEKVDDKIVELNKWLNDQRTKHV